jgi:hypothetical protein
VVNYRCGTIRLVVVPPVATIGVKGSTTRRTGRTVIGIVFAVLVSCLMTIGILYALALRHREHARAFLPQFVALKLGESSFTDAQQLARQYGGIPWYVANGDMSCRFQKCSLVFKFENMPLTYVPFIHHTELFGEIFVVDGIVVSRQLEYERNTRRDYYFRYLIIDSASLENEHKYGTGYGTWRLKVDSQGIPRMLLVRLGPKSSVTERTKAYSLDLSCLAQLFGCDVPSAFYPRGIPYRGLPVGGQILDER